MTQPVRRPATYEDVLSAVDPRDRTIEVLRRRESSYELFGTWGGDEGPFALEPFDSAELPASAF
jgi:hypothetical protein